MLFWMFFLLGVYASAAGSQDFGFVCGFEPGREAGATGQIHDLDLPFYQSGTVRPLILFGKLKSPDDPFSLTQLKDRNGNETESSANLLNAGHEGSLAHYFNEMSYGALTLESNNDGVEGMWFEAASTKATDYGTNCLEAIRNFAEAVFDAADETIEFSDYDRDGEDRDDDGVGDGDGVVDLVILYIPQEFKVFERCGFSGRVFTNSTSSYRTKDSVSIDGNTISVSINDNIIYVFQRPSFPYLVGVTAHEYGHVMNLPDLLDIQSDDPSAGIGLWDLMGWGPFGWSWNLDDDWSQNSANDLYSGPTPLSVWSRYKVGWITEDNGRLVTVESDTENAATLHDINSQSSTVKAYKIPIRGSDTDNSDTEYFLMANRQNTYTEHSRGSYYDDLAEASGLAIWHIDDGLPIQSSGSNELRFDRSNNNEKHKRVDLECADGLFSDQGYPSNNPDPVAGGDNLDYASLPVTNNGNLGDATDLWDGSTDDYKHFTPSSNPSTYGYNDNRTPDDYTDDRQSVFSGIAVRNISQTHEGVMSFDVRFIPSAPEGLVMATYEGTTLVALGWSEPDVNATAISGYQYSIDEKKWTTVDGGADARSVIFDDSTSTTFWVRAITAHEQGEAAKINLDRPGTVVLTAVEPTLHTPPTVGDVLTATLTDANVTDWADDSVTWLWQRKLPTAKTWTDIVTVTATNTNTYTLVKDDVGHQVQVVATYSDGAAIGSDMATSDPVMVNSPPTITTDTAEATNVSVMENSEKVVYTYMATDPDEGNMVKWSLGATDQSQTAQMDASQFLIDADTGALTFEVGVAPNFEELGSDHSYAVNVIASDGSLSAISDGDGNGNRIWTKRAW